VGNDFLPPLPTLDIAEGALNSLFDIYKEELPTLGGYITYEGVFDAARLERILTRLAALEADVLAQRCARHVHDARFAWLTLPCAVLKTRRTRPRRRGGARSATRSATAPPCAASRLSWMRTTPLTRCVLLVLTL
jgi:hypothetical protein